MARSSLALRCLTIAKRASHIDPPKSPSSIMRRARPYRGENHGPGKEVSGSEDVINGELDPRPGIREQPGPTDRFCVRRETGKE